MIVLHLQLLKRHMQLHFIRSIARARAHVMRYLLEYINLHTVHPLSNGSEIKIKLSDIKKKRLFY